MPERNLPVPALAENFEELEITHDIPEAEGYGYFSNEEELQKAIHLRILRGIPTPGEALIFYQTRVIKNGDTTVLEDPTQSENYIVKVGMTRVKPFKDNGQVIRTKAKFKIDELPNYANTKPSELDESNP